MHCIRLYYTIYKLLLTFTFWKVWQVLLRITVLGASSSSVTSCGSVLYIQEQVQMVYLYTALGIYQVLL
jgi:hypothetical protein